jgi:hypothetical protein
MPTCNTTGILEKLAHTWQATYWSGNSTTFFWSTNLALLIVLMLSSDDPIMILVTRTMRMSQFGQMNTFVVTTLPSEFLIPTALNNAFTWSRPPTNQSFKAGPPFITSP